MWHGLRWVGAIAIAIVATTAGAQSANLGDYALFAVEGLRARGLRVPAGDVGVNAGPLWVTDALDGPDTTVVADLARVGRKSRCLEILAGEVVDPVAGCPAGAAFTGPLVPDVADACGFPSDPPACDPSNAVDVGHDETRTLPPGVYGDLVIAGGGGGKGTLVLEGGDYVFCSIRTSRKSELTFAGPSTVFVEENVTLGTGSTTGPAPGSGLTAADLEMFVGGSSVRFSRRAEVTGRLCAPDARLVLTMGSRVVGSFVARLIRADRVTATNEGSVTPTTSTSSTTTTSTTSSSTTTSLAPSTSTTSTTSTSSTSTTETSTTTTTSTVPGACDPELGLRATVTVSYNNASGDLNAALVELVYPGVISIPGSGMDASVQSRIIPIALDILALGNDKDTDVNGVDETLTVGIVSLADEPANLGDGIQPGQVFAVQFDCDGGLPPDSSAVGCFVKDAVDAVSNPVQGVTCSVALAPGTPITTTTTEPPTTTTSTVATTTTSTTTVPSTTSSSTTTSTVATTTTSTVPSTTTSTTTVPSTTSSSTTTSSVTTTTTTTSTSVAPTSTTSSSSTTTTSSSSSTTTTSSSTSTTSSSTTTTSSTSSTSSTSTTSSTTSTSTSTTTSTTVGGPAVCGNGVVEGTEQCDDMNDDNNDDCVAGCKDAVCGDGFFHSGVEACDDHNTVNGDGCSSTCTVEPPVCGNNRIEAGETCDDGNTLNGDACPSNCRIEFCSPTAVRQDTTVTFTKPAGVNVGSMVVFVNYPDAKVSLPGTGNGATVRARITTLPTGFVHTSNDLDYAIREVLSPSLPGNILNGATLFKASYDLCSGATAPAAGEYTCTVEQVGAPNGASISPTGFTCTVTIP